VGLKDRFSGGGGMDDPVRGTAQVVSASANRGRGVFQTCNLQMVVQADGVPATAVSFNGLVHRDRWPTPGMVLPVTVDRSAPRNVTVEWDEVPSSRDRSRANAETLAAMLRGERAPAAGSGGAGSPPRAPPPPGKEVDERLSRLERLARLREQGVLTEEEFRTQKREILDG